MSLNEKDRKKRHHNKRSPNPPMTFVQMKMAKVIKKPGRPAPALSQHTVTATNCPVARCISVPAGKSPAATKRCYR
jgi:hypothetical protein